MADFAYNLFKADLLRGLIDLAAGSPDDIRVLALQAASDEDKDDDDVAAVLARGGTTEMPTSNGYARQNLANEDVSTDDVNDRGEFDADDVVFSSVSQAASEQIVAIVVFKFVTNDAGSLPMIFIDAATGMPLTPNGSDITITWNAEGILQAT